MPAVVGPALLRGGDQGHPLEIMLDNIVEGEEVEYERREQGEEESQYEQDYSDELEWCSYTPPSNVEVWSRKRSSDEQEDAEADDADRLRAGTPPKRAGKGWMICPLLRVCGRVRQQQVMLARWRMRRI